MKPTLEWLSDPEIYQVGREPAHSDHRFYTSYEEMRQHPEGSLRQSLDGEWMFEYSPSPALRPLAFYHAGVNLDSIRILCTRGMERNFCARRMSRRKKMKSEAMRTTLIWTRPGKGVGYL